MEVHVMAYAWMYHWRELRIAVYASARLVEESGAIAIADDVVVFAAGTLPSTNVGLSPDANLRKTPDAGNQDQ